MVYGECMRNKLAWIGTVFTLIYLIGFTWFIYGRLPNLQTMDLNSVGDFLAGSFGPIAFFWLILGFMQQGMELRISAKALEAQAKELRSSVEQQKELVAVSRSQHEATENNIRLENDRIASSIEPKFVLVGSYIPERLIETAFRFTLYNGGFLVTNLEVRHNDIVIHATAILASVGDTSFELGFKDDDSVTGGELRVTYLNGVERVKEKAFAFGFVQFGGRSGFQVLINQRQGAFVQLD